MTQNNLSFKREVIIPAGKAIVLGGFSALTAIAVLRARGTANDAWGVVFGLVVASVDYWILVWNTGAISKIKPPPTVNPFKTYAEEIQISVIDKTDPVYPKGRFIKTKISKERLIKLALHLKGGGKFSGTDLGGHGKLFSRNEYEKLRKDFLDGGLVRWKNEYAPTVGLDLTYGGRAFVRHYSSLQSIPPFIPKHYGDRQKSPVMHKHMQIHT